MRESQCHITYLYSDRNWRHCDRQPVLVRVSFYCTLTKTMWVVTRGGGNGAVTPNRLQTGFREHRKFVENKSAAGSPRRLPDNLRTVSSEMIF